VIVTGTIDIEFTSLTNAGTPVITPECPMEGERFEKFQALARAAKSEGSLILGQVNHAGRQVPAEINPEAISASDVQIGKSMLTEPRV
jgi:2,4-dienoyl-CoA reductase-like NADH-dependent reductase (Old Yellow Enzyme family)